MNTNDPAVWLRVRVIPFESTFCDNAPVDEDEQIRLKMFPKDENFDDKVESMLEPLFWLLVRRYPTIRKVIYEPPKVVQYTEQYRKSQDVYSKFVEEKIMKDETRSIGVTELYSSFREWHRQSYPGSQCPTKDECADYFLDVWGDMVGNSKWKGYRVRTTQDDIEEGKAEQMPRSSNPFDFSEQ
jgi:phage/plasmid-associated DNA primase